jgi:hypothetical protein
MSVGLWKESETTDVPKRPGANRLKRRCRCRNTRNRQLREWWTHMWLDKPTHWQRIHRVCPRPLDALSRVDVRLTAEGKWNHRPGGDQLKRRCRWLAWDTVGRLAEDRRRWWAHMDKPTHWQRIGRVCPWPLDTLPWVDVRWTAEGKQNHRCSKETWWWSVEKEMQMAGLGHCLKTGSRQERLVSSSVWTNLHPVCPRPLDALPGLTSTWLWKGSETTDAQRDLVVIGWKGDADGCLTRDTVSRLIADRRGCMACLYGRTYTLTKDWPCLPLHTLPRVDEEISVSIVLHLPHHILSPRVPPLSLPTTTMCQPPPLYHATRSIWMVIISG